MHKYKRNSHCFTLVELLMVISIIALLAGMVFPSFSKARGRAKFTRWLTYNVGYNRDSDTVINFNFEKEPYQIEKNGVTTEVVKNSAIACDAEQFNADKSYGVLMNSPEWVKGGGRWSFKNALQFDGREDYIEIIENSIINFDPSKDAFTVITWVNFYKDRNNFIFAKTRKFYGQYNCALRRQGRLGASAGRRYQEWNEPKIETMRWYHIVLVSDPAKGFQVYIDGKKASEPRKPNRKLRSIISSDPLTIGGMLRNNNSKDLNRWWAFRGRMDEFLLLKRALSEREISKSYLMGNPY